MRRTLPREERPSSNCSTSPPKAKKTRNRFLPGETWSQSRTWKFGDRLTALYFIIWIYPRAGKKTLWSTVPFMKKWNIYACFIYPWLHSVRSLRSKLSVRFSLIWKGALFILVPRLRLNSWAWKQALKETVENSRTGYSRYPGRSSQVLWVPRGWGSGQGALGALRGQVMVIRVLWRVFLAPWK